MRRGTTIEAAADTTRAGARRDHGTPRRALAALVAVTVGLVVALSGWAAAAAQPAGPDDDPATSAPPTTTPTPTTPTTTTPTTSTPLPQGEARTITATGAGLVEAVPDVVTVRIGAETRAATVAEALEENGERTTAVLDALRGRGVEDRDLQTSDLSLSPTYGDEGTTVTGYVARNVVTARLRDVGAAGATIDAAVQAAGDAARLEGLTFSVADDAALLAEARRLAVEDAQAKAGQLAEAAGVPLGVLLSVAESNAGGGPAPLARDQAAGGAVPLAPGTQQLRVDVVVVYAIG